MARAKSRKRVARAAPTRTRFTRLEVDARRAQLVALGLEAFSQRPYDEVSLDELARRAGLSKGLLYHYFPSKRDYYVVSIREAARQLLARTYTPDEVPAAERLARGLDAFLDYVEAHRAAYTALMRGGIGSDREVAGIIEETRARFVERLLHGMPAQTASALLRTAVRGWVGFVEATSLEQVEKKEIDRDALRRLLIGALAELIRLATDDTG